MAVNRANKDFIVLEGMEARRVGEGVRELRLRRGLSIDELAQKAGVSRDYLNSLEEGQELKVYRSVLDNLNRKNIFEHVKANPGVHFNQLLRDLEMQPGALSYHLNVLEKKEYVKSIQDGNYRRFFLYGTSTDFKIALTSIQLRILSIVNERPGISQSKISESIGKNRMLINYHVKILRDAGIISVEKSGRESLCFTTSSAMIYLPG